MKRGRFKINPASEVGVHYLIGRDSTLYHLVDESRRACPFRRQVILLLLSLYFPNKRLEVDSLISGAIVETFKVSVSNANTGIDMLQHGCAQFGLP